MGCPNQFMFGNAIVDGLLGLQMQQIIGTEGAIEGQDFGCIGFWYCQSNMVAKAVSNWDRWDFQRSQLLGLLPHWNIGNAKTVVCWDMCKPQKGGNTKDSECRECFAKAVESW